MAKRNVFKFEAGPVEFTVIGISSHENDYRLSWNINEQLGFHFTQGNSLFNKAGKEFTCFAHEDEDRLLLLISNRCDNGFLLEKYKNFDFILKINNGLDEMEMSAWLRDLRKTPLISAAFPIPINKQILQILG